MLKVPSYLSEVIEEHYESNGLFMPQLGEIHRA